MKKFLALAVAFVCLGCQQSRPTEQAGGESLTIVVAAAANLTAAMPELTARFNSTTGIRVVTSFGATADLARQIENGAPFDVFAAADTAYIDALDSKGLLTPGSRSLYARGRLVMWLPAKGLSAEKIEDITGASFERIAIAKPDLAPYGRATVETLRALGIWEKVEKKVVYGQSVAQTKQFASTGNAEVAFIPLALVKPGEGSYVSVDERLHQPIDQALGIVKGSSHQEAARKFVDFLLSDEAQEILGRNGYFRIKPS